MEKAIDTFFDEISPDSFDEGLGWTLLFLGGGLTLTRKPKAVLGGVALALLGAYID